MSIDYARTLTEDFLKTSWPCIETLANTLVNFKESKRSTTFFKMKNAQKTEATLDGSHFFLRGSVEYSNPQLTVEDVQGIIAARLLEVCGNYFHESSLHPPEPKDIEEILNRLKNPPTGKIVAFLLNTDDVEPDRYSMNPLKESIVNSGQSAFPAVHVKTDRLEIDQRFAQKYDGSLISKAETELIAKHLQTCKGNYMDMCDAVKYEQMQQLSEPFGIDLCLPLLRMPLSTLEAERHDGLLHYVIREMHRDYNSIELVYNCIGRSMKNRTTLLTIPHSPQGFGSKRAARGKIYFDGTKLKNIKVTFQTTALYPNAIDPAEIAVARAEDEFTVEGEKLTNYHYDETPSSPQFFLYSAASPEKAALWHGIGAFGSSQLVGSYMTIHQACTRNMLIRDLAEKYGITKALPLQFNLKPSHEWFHPVHRNIDASIGCITNLKDLVNIGMKVETLPPSNFLRSQNEMTQP